MRHRLFGWLQSSKTGVARATLTVAAGTGVSRVIGFAATLAVASILGPSELGRFGFTLATASVMASVGVLGLSPLLVRAIADSRTSQGARCIASVALLGATGALATVSLFYLAASTVMIPVFGGTPPRFEGSLVIVAVWAVVAGLNPLLLAIPPGHRQFSLLSRLTVIRAVFVAGGMLVGSMLLGNALGAQIGTITGEVIAMIAAISAMLRRRWFGKVTAPQWRLMWHTLIKGAVASGLASFLIQLAMWTAQALLLQTPHGYAANGGFLLATRLTLVTTFLPNALAISSLPFLADSRSEPSEMRTRRRVILVSTLVLSVPAAIFTSFLVYFWLSEVQVAFVPYRSSIIIMCLAGMVIAANNVAGSIAVAAQQIRLWVTSDVILATGMAGMSAFLIPALGANGAAISYLLAYLLSLIVLLSMMRQPRPSGDVRPHHTGPTNRSVDVTARNEG